MRMLDSYDSVLAEERFERRLERLSRLSPEDKLRMWNSRTFIGGKRTDLLHGSDRRRHCMRELAAWNAQRLREEE